MRGENIAIKTNPRSFWFFIWKLQMMMVFKIKNKETFPSSITLNLNNIFFSNNAIKCIIPAGILSHRQWHSWRRNLPFGSQTSQAWWFWHRAGSGLVSRRQQALAGSPDNWEHNFLRNQRDIYFKNLSFLHLFQKFVFSGFWGSKSRGWSDKLTNVNALLQGKWVARTRHQLGETRCSQ